MSIVLSASLEMGPVVPGQSESAMNLAESARSGTTRRGRRARTGWVGLTLAGAAAFWTANLAISLTPFAAGYRSALSIQYLPMLVEAAVGGFIVAAAVTLILDRLPNQIPGAGPVGKALFLAVCALLVLTVLLEVPAKLTGAVDDPVRWLVVATAFNTVRILALGLAIGLVARARRARADRRPRAVTKEKKA